MSFNFAREGGGGGLKKVFFQIFGRVLFEKNEHCFCFFQVKTFFWSCFIAEKIELFFFFLIFFFDKKKSKKAVKSD